MDAADEPEENTMTHIDITAADLGRIDSTPVTVADLLPELTWDAPAGADLTGYSMANYFDLDVHEVYDSRRDAIQAMRDSYLGRDEHGVGLRLGDLGSGIV